MPATAAPDTRACALCMGCQPRVARVRARVFVGLSYQGVLPYQTQNRNQRSTNHVDLTFLCVIHPLGVRPPSDSVPAFASRRPLFALLWQRERECVLNTAPSLCSRKRPSPLDIDFQPRCRIRESGLLNQYRRIAFVTHPNNHSLESSRHSLASLLLSNPYRARRSVPSDYFYRHRFSCGLVSLILLN